MRETIADVISVPIGALDSLGALVRRSLIAQLAAIAAIAVVVVGLLVVALPPNSLRSTARFDPTAPSALATDLSGEYPLDKPVTIPFNKPMDAASVAASLKLDPASSVALAWDEAGEILSLSPQSFWSPSTTYAIDISPEARDRNGLPLGQGVHMSFVTSSLTSGVISATEAVGKELSPTTSFQITFTRPVKLATVVARFGIGPVVAGALTGDDPTDAASQVFTFTPNAPLSPGTEYTVTFLNDLARDAAGMNMLPVDSFRGTTVSGPAVVRFRPRNKATSVAPDQTVSVRFTTAMDTAATEAAFGLEVNGTAVTGKMSWVEHNTVLVFDPIKNFPFGATVTARVTDAAMAAGGMKLGTSASAIFHVIKPTNRKVPTGGGVPIAQSPWSSMEQYALRLINCTRTGGWVVVGGSCSSYGHHTMPRQSPLVYDRNIAAKVARPWAKWLADRGLFAHNADYPRLTIVEAVHRRFERAGYTSAHFGENLGSKPATPAGQVGEEIYYQNESPCRCEHYLNIMWPNFRRVGVGIWISKGRTRLVESFYG